VYFTRAGITLALAATAREPEAGIGAASDREQHPASTRGRWAVKLDFMGADPDAEPVGRDLTPAVVSYFKGDQANWHTGLPTYGSVVYEDLWPGVDLVYAGPGGRLKYTFVVHPGADPSMIRLAYRGATSVRLTEGGRLAVETPVASFEEDAPYVYQEIDGKRTDVEAAYVLGKEAAGSHGYGFRLGAYDRSQPLIIDPVVLAYCGFIGGSGSNDFGYGIAVDAAGNAYVAGETDSTEASFPETAGSLGVTYNGGNRDAFVAKVNPGGTALVYCAYIGGSGEDKGFGIAVDGSGNAYVAGRTDSTEASFPETVGPDLFYNGGVDAFVAKVNASGTALVYCGYIGGSGDDVAYAIAVDGSANAYVTGAVQSTEASFPVTVGPGLTYNAFGDAFVAKVSVSGAAPLVYCGYIGGSGDEAGLGIAVVSGNAYVTGRTSSTEASFPVTVGPDLTSNGGDDAFVAKVSVSGAVPLVYCGYIGGSGLDIGYGITVDGPGSAYVSGTTDSTEASFPETVGPDLTSNGGNDAFVAKVSVSGAAPLVYCGYIGGSAADFGYRVAVDDVGSVYIVGQTQSTEASFPVTVGPDLTSNGGDDAFVAKVSVSGAAPLVYCGYIGGTGTDFAYGIAVDAARDAYVVGAASSTEASFPVLAGPDLSHNGGTFDAFVAKVHLTAAAVYYSVGTSTADLKLGSPTITIVGGVATFSVAQADSVGVGDAILYGGSTAFIFSRISSTRYLVSTNVGATPANVSGVLVTSIKRAFNTLSDAEANSSDASHLGTADLVTLKIQLNWACYEDGPMDDQVVIDGYTTSASYYIRVFTPVLPNQVGTSQRHTGTAGSGFVLQPLPPRPEADTIVVKANHVRIEGLEIDGSQYSGSYGYGGVSLETYGASPVDH
jgi:hypothetical protein